MCLLVVTGGKVAAHTLRLIPNLNGAGRCREKWVVSMMVNGAVTLFSGLIRPYGVRHSLKGGFPREDVERLAFRSDKIS